MPDLTLLTIREHKHSSSFDGGSLDSNATLINNNILKKYVVLMYLVMS